MKQAINTLVFLSFSLVISCQDSVWRKKLNLKTIKNDDILVETYDVSEISTIHQFIDMTNRRWSRVETILEANQSSIDCMFIRGDTLFLQKASSGVVIYDSASTKFGYSIILLEPKGG